jgi:hypothetical protein
MDTCGLGPEAVVKEFSDWLQRKARKGISEEAPLEFNVD